MPGPGPCVSAVTSKPLPMPSVPGTWGSQLGTGRPPFRGGAAFPPPEPSETGTVSLARNCAGAAGGRGSASGRVAVAVAAAIVSRPPWRPATRERFQPFPARRAASWAPAAGARAAAGVSGRLKPTSRRATGPLPPSASRPAASSSAAIAAVPTGCPVPSPGSRTG